MTKIQFTARAKAFSGQGVRTHRFLLSDTIRVWDDIASHYTVCHCLSRRTITRLRNLAK